jgi:hypothetical protein
LKKKIERLIAKGYPHYFMKKKKPEHKIKEVYTIDDLPKIK